MMDFAGSAPMPQTDGGVNGTPLKSMTRAEAYLEKKVAGVCVYPGCQHPASDEAVRCERHQQKQRKAVRRSLQKRRDALRAAGKCVVCQKRSAFYRCSACSIRSGRTPTVGANTGANTSPATPAQWRVDPGTTWNRYRGKAKRGAPSPTVLDAQDLDSAIDEITKAKSALVFARSETVQAMPKIQRDDVMRAALGRLDYAERWLDEVRGRHKSR